MSYRLLLISRTTALLGLVILVELTVPPLVILLISNAVLYLAVMLTGYPGGVIIGLMVPWIAFQLEHFPVELTPVMPYLILGNIALVCTFYYFYHKRVLNHLEFCRAIVLASIAKFLVIHLPIIIYLHLPPTYEAQLIQLYAAVAGGIVALLCGKGLRFKGVKDFHELDLKGTPL